MLYQGSPHEEGCTQTGRPRKPKSITFLERQTDDIRFAIRFATAGTLSVNAREVLP